MVDKAGQTQNSRRFEGASSADEIKMPSVRDVFRVGFRHKWLILAVFILVSTVGILYALQQPDYYRSSGSVMLRDERGSLAINPASDELVTAAPEFSTAPTGSAYAILTSQELAKDVIRKVGPAKVLEFKPGETVEQIYTGEADPIEAATRDALSGFSKALKVNTDGQVIEITYTHGDPSVAQAIVAEILNTYQDRHILLNSSSGSPAFVREQLATLSAELETKQAALKDLQEKHGISSVTLEKEATLAAVSNLDQQLTDTRIALEASQGRLDALAEALGGRGVDAAVGPMEIANPEVVALREILNSLRAEKVRLDSIYVSGTELRSINRQIEDTEAKIKSLPATVPRPLGGTGEVGAVDPALALEDQKIEHSGLLATKRKLEEELVAARERLKELEAHEWPLSTLENEVNRLSAKYRALQEGLDLSEAEVALDQARVSNVSVLQPATLPDEPEGPRRNRMMAMALFAGMMAGLSIAFVREFFDATLKSRDEAEKKLGMTVLAVVPEREFRKCI